MRKIPNGAEKTDVYLKRAFATMNKAEKLGVPKKFNLLFLTHIPATWKILEVENCR